jgi:succinoglycan biosynthesis protein ExoA
MSSASTSSLATTRRPDRADTTSPYISVVVPVRNEAAFVERTLTQLVDLDYDPQRYEVLVVDGQSTDGTPELVAEFATRHANVRLFDNPRQLSSAARNIAIRNAQGDLVVVVDGHCELEGRDYLTRLADAFDRSGADCVGRPQPLDIPGATPLQQATAAARSSRLGHHPDSYIYSAQECFVPAKSVAIAYRRSVFDTVGLFDETFDACEDVELNHRVDRAGLRCFFTPRVVVHYAPRSSLRGLYRQLVRYGRGRVRLFRKHPETFSSGMVPPTLFVAGLVAGLPLSLASDVLASVYAGGLLVYAAGVLGVSAWSAARTRRPALFFWLPPVFFTIHFAAGAGMLAEWIRPTRRPSCRGAKADAFHAA